VYIVGVHTKKAKLKIPFNDWGDLLDDLKSELPSTIHDYMLPDSDPDVCDARGRLRTRPGVSSETSSMKAALVSKKKTYGLKWVKNHSRFRKGLGMGDSRPVTMHKQGWARFLSLRSRDVLDMTGAKIEKMSGVAVGDTDMCAEISRGFGYVRLRLESH